MPEHKRASKRSDQMTLDALFDESREQKPLPPGTLDFILMGYRYGHLYIRELQRFRSEPLNPLKLSDFWQLTFAALLTRDHTPGSALVSTTVELAREIFGERTSRVTNAFLRHISRSKKQLIAEVQSSPELLLGDMLCARWNNPALQKHVGRQLAARPPAGVHAFDAHLNFGLRPASEFANAELQAMDPGSWNFLAWLRQQIPAGAITLLDACAAPGGKSIALKLMHPTTPRIFATDAKFARLERLKENFRRWKLDIPTELFAWGEDAELPGDWPASFDFILADLPCSGSGTFHTRPDLLFSDINDRVQSLAPLQREIIDALKARLNPGGRLCVSVCSVDPAELANIEAVLPDARKFSSLTSPTDAVEGISAWLIAHTG